MIDESFAAAAGGAVVAGRRVYERTRLVEGPATTHLRFRVRR